MIAELGTHSGLREKKCHSGQTGLVPFLAGQTGHVRNQGNGLAVSLLSLACDAISVSPSSVTGLELGTSPTAKRGVFGLGLELAGRRPSALGTGSLRKGDGWATTATWASNGVSTQASHSVSLRCGPRLANEGEYSNLGQA